MSNVISFQAYKNATIDRGENLETVLLQLERVVFAMQLKRDKAYETLNHVMDYCKRKKMAITESLIQKHLRRVLDDISLEVISDKDQIVTIDMLLDAFQVLDTDILGHQNAIKKAQQYFLGKKGLSHRY